MATKKRAAKKSKRRRGVMTTLATGMANLYGRVKQKLARKPKVEASSKAAAKQPAKKKKSAKPSKRRTAAKRTRKQ